MYSLDWLAHILISLISCWQLALDSQKILSSQNVFLLSITPVHVSAFSFSFPYFENLA